MTAPMECVEACTAEEFRSRYRNKAAVCFRGLVGDWAACQSWRRREHMEAALGGAASTVRAQTSPSNIFPAVYARNATDTAEIAVSTVLDATLFAPKDGPPPPLLYCKLSLAAALRRDVGGLPESVFGEPSKLSTSGETTFWMGSGGVVTPLHFDHCHTVISQVVGRKRVIVSPLDDSEHLYPRSVADGAPRTSRIDLGAWLRGDATQRALYPDVVRARLYETELTPGDLVYIPPGWWHYVEALEGNASVLLPFDMSVAEQQSLPRPWAAPEWGARQSGSADEAAAAKATGTAPALPTAADEEEVVEEMDDALASFALDELDYASDDADGDAAVGGTALEDRHAVRNAARLWRNPTPIAEALPALSADTFRSHHRNASPVVVRGLASAWPACAQWSDAAALVALAVDGPTTQLEAADGEHFLRCDCTVTTVDFSAAARRVFGGGEAGRPRVMVRAPLSGGLLAAVAPDDVAALMGGAAVKLPNCGVWFGSAGSVTPLHYDLCHGFLCQIVGRKVFTFVAPDDTRCLHRRADRPEVADVDPDLWSGDGEAAAAERARHPAFAELGTVWSVELGPGDVLYTPPFWWHHVRTHDDGPALSVLVPFDPEADEAPHPCHYF